MIPHQTLFQHQLGYVWPTSNLKTSTQNVTNITFIFETSPNTKPKEKKVGGHGILCPRLKKWGDIFSVPPTKLRPWWWLLLVTLCEVDALQWFVILEIYLNLTKYTTMFSSKRKAFVFNSDTWFCWTFFSCIWRKILELFFFANLALRSFYNFNKRSCRFVSTV